jgi:hypothetical protein
MHKLELFPGWDELFNKAPYRSQDGRFVAIVTPSTSNPGMVQLTRFDKYGPVGHSTHYSKEEAEHLVLGQLQFVTPNTIRIKIIGGDVDPTPYYNGFGWRSLSISNRMLQGPKESFKWIKEYIESDGYSVEVLDEKDDDNLTA